MMRRREAELGARLLREAREELVRADGKASLLLAATTLVAGTVLAAILSGAWRPSSLDACAQGPWWVGVIAGCWGLASLGIAVYPRTRPRKGSRQVVAYFGDVLGLDPEDLRAGIVKSARSEAPVVDQLTRVSQIVSKKFFWIRSGMWSFVAAFVLCVGSVVASHFL